MRPGLSGWKKEKAEVLELLTFWKPEQQAVHRFRIWRPPPFDLLKNCKLVFYNYFQLSKYQLLFRYLSKTIKITNIPKEKKDIIAPSNKPEVL